MLIRGGVLLLTPDALREDPDGYRRLAENLVAHGTFGDGQRAHGLPPAAVSAAADRLRGPGRLQPRGHRRAARRPRRGDRGLVLVLGRWWGLDRRAAALAALLVACDPILLRWSTQVMTETLATFLRRPGCSC